MLSVKYKVGHVEIKSFKKSCATKAECENPGVLWQRCNDNHGKPCAFQCCEDTDLCNGGHAVPLVSTLLMLACFLVTFFR